MAAVRIALIMVSMMAGVSTYAGDVQDVLALWGAQGGPWKGYIDIYGPDSTEPQRVDLTTRWDSVPDHSIVTKLETFATSDRQTSAVTLMMKDSGDGDILTPYFAGGRQRDFRFSVTSVDIADDTHWKIVVATPGGEEIYEDRPAMLRYVRVRNGDTIENWKEVRFLDGASDADEEYELRSFIRQTLVP